MLWLFITSFSLGIAFCAPPGAVTAEALRRGIAGGFRPVLLLELGSLVGDATWAILALVGAAVLVQNTVARLILGAVGVVLLLWLAWGALRDAQRGGLPQARGTLGQGDFSTGALLSLGNPFAISFWLGVGGAVVATGVANPGPIHFVVFFSAFMFASLLWCVFISSIITWGRRWITPAACRVLNLICGIALAYFALRLAWDTFLLF